ncbi:MAG: hypothetical protein COA75_06950 [Cellvibrionales bacterium]|nr:MAG: hypothetical protein COA75_06950 [Cellvibrionales bacterium]
MFELVVIITRHRWFCAVKRSRFAAVVVLACFSALLVACGDLQFRPQNLAKSDIDLVADLHYRETQDLLRSLTVKLYKRNPDQLKHGLGRSIDQRLSQLFAKPGYVSYEELSFARGTDALELGLSSSYTGDRVMAMMAGLNGMIRHAYGYKEEFFMFDDLDQQKFYESARNIEMLVWRLAHSGGNRGPLLLTNSQSGEPVNLSFERLFGKLIASQDMMARVVALKNERLINRTAQNVAALVFFPL